MNASTADVSPRRTVLGAAVSTLTGVAAAFGLSASGLVLGALLARGLDTLDVLPDGFGTAPLAVIAAVGVVGAGATVAEVSGGRARPPILIAGGLLFAGLWQILRSVESTGAEGGELPVVVAVAVTFIALLGAGARLQRYGSRRVRNDEPQRRWR